MATGNTKRTRKGQNDIVGALIIIVIVLLLVAAAFVWGSMLIEKKGDAQRIETVKGLFEAISSDLNTVAESTSQKERQINLDKGDFQLETDALGEYVLTYTADLRLMFFASREMPINDYTSPYFSEQLWAEANETNNGTLWGVDCGGTTFNYKCGPLMPNLQTMEVPTELDGKMACIADDKTDSICVEGIGNRTGMDTNVSGDYKIYYVGYDDTTRAGEIGLEGKTGSVPGRVGQDKLGVILARSVMVGNKFRTTLKLKPRVLIDPSGKITKIEIVRDSNLASKATGRFLLEIKYVRSYLSADGNTRTIQISLGMKNK